MTHDWRTTRPGTDEHHAYYAGYIAQVPDGDIIPMLGRQLEESLRAWRAIPESRGGYRYAEGKWSIKEVISHLSDAERVFSYRALRAARNDQSAVPGFDENAFAKHSEADRRTMADLISEFEHLRRSNIALFASFDDEAARRRVTANGSPITARALVWVIAGHELHHGRVLKERYLGA